MAKVVLQKTAVADLDRSFDFLLDKDPLAAIRARRAILEALQMLSAHPKIGRPAERGRRELVISWGQTGYVALYRVRRDVILVLTIRHQREVLRDEDG